MKKLILNIVIGVAISLSAFSTVAQEKPQATLLQPPSEEQIKSFQRGDIEELSKYIGKENTVVLATIYKAHWGANTSFKREIICSYRVVLSNNSDFSTGMKFVCTFPIEIEYLTASLIKKFENPNGGLVYLFNLKECGESKSSRGLNAPICRFDRQTSVANGDVFHYETLKNTLKLPKGVEL